MSSDFKLRPEYLQLGHPLRKRVINLITLVLRAVDGNHAAAARELGCSRAWLYRCTSAAPELRALRTSVRKIV